LARIVLQIDDHSTSPTGQCGRPEYGQSGPSSATQTARTRDGVQPMNDRTSRTSTFAPSPSPAPQAAKSATHVLVVDDDTDIRGTLRMALEDAGYTVHEAPDGLIAMDLLLTSPALLQQLASPLLPKPYNIDALLEAIQAAEQRLASLAADRPREPDYSPGDVTQ
jgi:hypothetical protein